MELYERLNSLIAVLTGGNVTAFCKKLSVRNTTFSNYLSKSGQQAMRLHQLLEVLEVYPQVSREWLFFDEGEMFVSGFRMGMRVGGRLPVPPHPDAEPEIATPVADAVRDAEIGLRKAGGTDHLIWSMVRSIANGKMCGAEEPQAAPIFHEAEPDTKTK